ncbi:MAG: CTP synthase [bacterium]
MTQEALKNSEIDAYKEQRSKIRKTKLIVITGGVCSSIGKGVLISSLGVLLQNAGYSVSVVKWDPYLNVDPGTMSPLEHGEVFVTCDGAETDLDLGHYERTLGVRLTKDSSVSSGQIFKEIIEGEREGKFLGRCIQLVPHVVDAIKNRFFTFAQKHDVDFVLLEIGGTVGDMEGQTFLEAIRQIRMEMDPRSIFHGHLSYVPYLEWTGEVKTKPTQHSVNALKEAGLMPDGLFLRAAKPIPDHAAKKLAIMCGVHKTLIFQVLSFNPIYKLFLDLDEQQVGARIQEYFGLSQARESDLSAWKQLIGRIGQCVKCVSIGLVAKYVTNNDPYISVIEALRSAGYACGVMVDVELIDAEALEKENIGAQDKQESAWQKIKKVDGIVVPGGFDKRGIEGKIAAARFARENNIPYFGLCLGLQVLLIEYARSMLKLEGAHSTEVDKNTLYPVVSLLAEQQEVVQKGASMRLGEYECSLVLGTQAYLAYQKNTVFERHRHRYEFNNKYKEQFEMAGLVFSGTFKDKDLIEIAEIKGHPFMLGTQFHPEFLSSPLKAHPLFKAFVVAIIDGKYGCES